MGPINDLFFLSWLGGASFSSARRLSILLLFWVGSNDLFMARRTFDPPLPRQGDGAGTLNVADTVLPDKYPIPVKQSSFISIFKFRTGALYPKGSAALPNMDIVLVLPGQKSRLFLVVVGIFIIVFDNV